jgi:hypothetical protein
MFVRYQYMTCGEMQSFFARYTTIKQGNGQNESILAILHVGKELYQEMHRNTICFRT